jgi:3-hydroxyisobutyrate dehydrogenase-like beta-hydroxyacid dehydrogenase
MHKTMQRFGFIGLGSQGAPMAQRMIDHGLDVVLWARRPETLEPFRSTSASVAPDVESLAEQVDYCAVCVVDDDGVQDICSRLIAAMPAGGTIVIHSTVNPQLCRELAEQANARGIEVLDAPVSGGGQAAAEGRLTVMLGGSEEGASRVGPVLETFTGKLIHLGGVGAGLNAKLVNNTLMAANLAVAHHALLTAKALDIDEQALVELLSCSSGNSFSLGVRSRMSTPTDFHHGAQLLAKDVRLLETAVGDNEDFTYLKQTAARFLDAALTE